MNNSRIRGGIQGVGWKVAMLTALLPGTAWAQDCDVDADCGHGFQCIHTSASAVTGGVGGSQAQAECGDSICDVAAEDVDSCPQDCDTLQYCAPAECDSDTDCAAGYECAEESNSGTSGSSTVGSGSVCGDGVCNFDESSDSCADDCPLYRTCRLKQIQCASDDDCADGSYCLLEATDAGSSVAVSGVDSTGTDTATSGSSDDSDSDSVTTDSGFVPPVDTGSATSGGNEVGVCLPESSDSGSTDLGSTGADTDAGSATTEGDDSASDGGATGPSAANGAGGMNSTLGSGSPASATGDDSAASASDGEASGTGGESPDAGSDDGNSGDEEGCSCAVLGTESPSGLVAALLFGLVAGVRRRRNGTHS